MTVVPLRTTTSVCARGSVDPLVLLAESVVDAGVTVLDVAVFGDDDGGLSFPPPSSVTRATATIAIRATAPATSIGVRRRRAGGGGWRCRGGASPGG